MLCTKGTKRQKHNILFVSPHVGHWGAERSMIALMLYLRKNGHGVYLIIPKNGEIEKLLRDNDINYFITNFYCWTNVGKGTRLFYGMGKYLYNHAASKKIVKHLVTVGFKPDIVHVNTIVTEMGIHLAHMTRAKLVWHIREYGKQAFHLYFDWGTKFTSHIMKKADIFIAVSKGLMENYHYLIDKDKIIYIYNGVEVKPLMSHERHFPTFKLVLVGRLSPEKRQEDAIRALKDIKDQGIHNISLDLYGTGTDEDRLVQLVKDLNVQDMVSFKGYQSNIDYSQYDVGLTCSCYEAFGRTTADYMMNSMPVIGADSGGTAELVRAETGLLYETGNIKHLVHCILDLYHSPEKCKAMGIRAHETAVAEFSYDTYCNNVEQVYDSI